MNLLESVDTYFWIVYCLVTIKIVKNLKLIEVNLKSNIRDLN